MGGRRNTREQKATRKALVALQRQMDAVEKRREDLRRSLGGEHAQLALADSAECGAGLGDAELARRRKEGAQRELETLEKVQEQLEAQMRTLRFASENVETVQVMRQANDALTDVQRDITIDNVNATLAQVRAQNEVAERVADGVVAHKRPLERAGRRLLARLRLVQRHKVMERVDGD